MKIIVTGALGHIGSKFIRDVAARFDHADIVMIDNASTQRFCSLFNLPENITYSFVESDVKDVDWNALLKSGIDAVIHLAALTDAAGTADKPQLVHDNNFESTKIISDACLSGDVPLIFPSSTSVYGSQSDVVDEECADLQPQSPYAACKIKEEQYIQSLCEKGLKAVVCRLGTIYGTSPGMRFHTAVNKFCWQAVMNQPVTVWETALHQKRPYLSLEDCSNALIWILKNKMYDSNLYNIVSNNFTVQDVINAIKNYVPDLNIKLVQHQIMNQLSYEIATDKFCHTGFQFKGQLLDGISDTINLLKKANG